MTGSSSLHLRLDLDISPDDDPVTGSIGPADGVRQPFVGWTELAAAIERLRRAADAAPPGTVTPTTAAGHERGTA